MRNVATLDGLRGLACLFVVFSHGAADNIQLIPPFAIKHRLGAFGVILFFCLSGFLLANLYDTNRFSFKFWVNYALRRIFRVYPLFIVSCLIFCITGYVAPMHDISWINLTNALLLMQLRISWWHLWTIPVELFFYAIFPLLIISLTYIRATPLIRILLVAGLFFLMEYWFPVIAPQRWETPWVYISIFTSGTIAGLIYKYYASRLTNAKLWNSATIILLLLLAGVILSMPAHILHLRNPWNDTIAYASIFSLLIFCASLSSGFAARILNNKPLCFIGKISYGLYLIHAVILLEFSYYVKPLMGGYATFCAAIAVSILVAYSLHRSVELPSIMLGKKLSEKLGCATKYDSPRHQH